MKKFVVILLALIMVFSLCSCGKDTIISDNITAVLSGDKSKQAKITLADQFTDEYILKYDTPKGDSPVYTAVVSKESKNSHSYVLTANATGQAIFAVSYLYNDEYLGYFSVRITVDESLKIDYSDVVISDSGVKKGLEDENVDARITSDNGPSQQLQLANGDGAWSVETYDKELLEVDGPGYVDAEHSSFRFTALAEGESSVYLVNENMGVQLVLEFKASTTAEGSLNLTLLNHSSSELSQSRPAAQETAKEIREKTGDSFIPDDAVIENAFYFDEKEVLEGDVPKTDIEFEMNFGFEGISMNYQCSKTVDKAKYMEYAEAVGGIEDQKDIKAGGIETAYYFYEDGFAIAVWEKEGKGYRLTFMDGLHSNERYQEMLIKLLDLDAL